MEIQQLFTWIDWAVIIGYLLLTTLVGHRLKGKQASIHDFFLGGRSLPWQAVTGSIIATEISGVTFIGVPGTLFALHGDFTYLQWAIGSIIARIFVGLYFVKVYYERDIYSPYDYMGRRLGSPAKTLATLIFTVGSILAQSVRVLVAAIPLRGGDRTGYVGMYHGDRDLCDRVDPDGRHAHGDLDGRDAIPPLRFRRNFCLYLGGYFA